MRLMVVDDDKQIREGITYGIQWENLGIDEAVCFKDGFDALAGMKAGLFDVALLDISMPGMTGIELLQELKRLDARIAVILISGYEEFEYARMGMRHGALDYISKPIHLDELTKTVLAVVEKCRKERGDAGIVEVAGRNGFMQRLFQGMVLSSEEVRRFLTEECGFPKTGVYMGVLLRSDSPDGLFLDEECAGKVVQAMTESLGGFLHRYFQVGKEEMYLLVHTADSALYLFNLRVQVRRMLEKMNAELGKGRGLSAAIVCPLDAAGLAGSYGRASALLERTFFEGPGCCLEEAGGDFQDGMKKGLRGRECRGEEKTSGPGIKDAGESGVEKLARLHGQCMQRFHLFDVKGLEDWQDAVRKEMYRCTKEDVHNFIKVNAAELLHEYKVSGQGCRWEELYRASYFTEMFPVWRECLVKLKEEVDETCGYSKEVQRVINYVKEHYAERIGVEQLADAMELSAGHLSRLFKAQTGISLKKYINKVRIEQALYLLKNTNMKVYEVAERVGIPDYLYFSQVFKHETAKTPMEVRKETRIGKDV